MLQLFAGSQLKVKYLHWTLATFANIFLHVMCVWVLYEDVAPVRGKEQVLCIIFIMLVREEPCNSIITVLFK